MVSSQTDVRSDGTEIKYILASYVTCQKVFTTGKGKMFHKVQKTQMRNEYSQYNNVNRQNFT